MIVIRFPTGFSVQYNSAHYVKWGTEGKAHLFTAENGQWIATVPADCILEWSPPCAMTNPGQTVEAVIDLLLAADLRGEPFRVQCKLGDLKALLADLNRQTFQWRRR